MVKKLLLFGIFLAIGPLFGMEKESKKHIDEQELQTITGIIPAELWCEISEYLPGNDLFLNGDIVRNIRVNNNVYDKIIASFLPTLIAAKNPIFAIDNFGKTTHLNDNELLKRFKKVRNLAKSIINTSSSLEYRKDDSVMSDVVNDAVKELIRVKQEKLSHFSVKELCVMALFTSIIMCAIIPGGSLLMEDIGTVLRWITVCFMGVLLVPGLVAVYIAHVLTQDKQKDEFANGIVNTMTELQTDLWLSVSKFEFNFESYRGISSICSFLAILGIISYKLYGKRSESKLINLQKISEIIE